MKTLQIFIPFCLAFLLSCDSSSARRAATQQAGFGLNSGQSIGQNGNQNSGQNAGQYGGQHSGQEVGQNAGQEVGQNAGQAVGQNAGQEVGQHAGQEVGQHAGQEVGQHAGQEVGQNAGHEVGQNAGQEVDQNAGQEVGQNGGQEVGQHAGQEVGQHAGQEVGQHAGQEVGQNAGEEVGQNAGHEVGQNAGQEVGQNAGQEVGQHSGQEVGQNTGHEVGQNAGQEVGQHSGQEVGQNVGQHDGPSSGHDGNQHLGQQAAQNAGAGAPGHHGSDVQGGPEAESAPSGPVGNSGANPNLKSTGYGIYDPEWAKQGLGGQLAHEGQFPYVVALSIDVGKNQVGACGGGLIAVPKNGRTVYAVLSAAHCFVGVPKNGEINITMGTTDATQQSSTKKVVKVPIGSVVNHPRYNITPDANDIAVIRLPSNFKLSKGISTLPIPDVGQENTDWSGIPTIFAGWGVNNEHSKNDNTKLVFFTTKTLTDRECAKAMGRSKSRWDNTLICLDGTDMKGSCQGDSGGPVAWRNAQDKPLQIIGVSSFRLTACEGETPTYHTRVATYVDWIKQNV